MSELIVESLEFYGVKPTESAEQLVARAREHSSLDEAAALELSVEESHRARSR